MGNIHINFVGSFKGQEQRAFSALDFGHAQAVENAIGYLQDIALPRAIQQDCKLAIEGNEPHLGFGLTAKKAMRQVLDRLLPGDEKTNREATDRAKETKTNNDTTTM